MDIQKAINYVEQVISEYDYDIRTEESELMRGAYTDVASHYRLILIALKEKQEREKKVEQLDGYSFEVGV